VTSASVIVCKGDVEPVAHSDQAGHRIGDEQSILILPSQSTVMKRKVDRQTRSRIVAGSCTARRLAASSGPPRHQADRCRYARGRPDRIHIGRHWRDRRRKADIVVFVDVPRFAAALIGNARHAASFSARRSFAHLSIHPCDIDYRPVRHSPDVYLKPPSSEDCGTG